ncbi:MAG: N-acetylneuraminate synthase [Actinomycetota bacterium]
MSVLVVAEAGVNHNGDLDRALEMVDVAAAAGADVIKFQAFKAESLTSRFAPKADYQVANTGDAGSQLEMLRRLELADDAYPLLMERCAMRGISFLATPFDVDSIRFLAVRLKLPRIKIASGEVTNGPYLVEAGRTGADIVLSTGMSTLDEIELALGALAFGRSGRPDGEAGPDAFLSLMRSDATRAALQGVLLLHCTTEYPSPVEDANLRAMDTLADRFGLPVGLSDHTPGITVAIAAAARGASMVEKHFTLDRSLPGPDHKASLEPAELRALVEGIRTVELALGDGIKSVRPSEARNLAVARKSLVAARPIRAGEPFDTANLAIKRPGGGISPMRYWSVLRQTADRDYAADEQIGI